MVKVSHALNHSATEAHQLFYINQKSGSRSRQSKYGTFLFNEATFELAKKRSLTAPKNVNPMIYHSPSLKIRYTPPTHQISPNDTLGRTILIHASPMMHAGTTVSHTSMTQLCHVVDTSSFFIMLIVLSQYDSSGRRRRQIY